MKNKVCFLMQTPRQFITEVFVGFVDVGKDSAAVSKSLCDAARKIGKLPLY